MLTRRDDRVLLVLQTSGPFAGSFILPGGAVERNETVAEGARRELREETGCELHEQRLVAVYQVLSQPAGSFDIVLFMFTGEVTGEPRPEAGSEVRWARPDEIALHPTLRRALSDAGGHEDNEAAMDAALAAIGVRMLRLA